MNRTFHAYADRSCESLGPLGWLSVTSFELHLNVVTLVSTVDCLESLY